MKTHDKTLLKIIQMLQDIVKRYASHMDDRDNIWHQTMKNDKYVLQMENKVWYLEWVNESLKKNIKQLDPDDTLSDWDWKAGDVTVCPSQSEIGEEVTLSSL